MNSIEHIRQQLRQLTALDYAARLRRELRLTPGDPDLHWALRELQGELDTQPPLGRQTRQERTQQATHLQKRKAAIAAASSAIPAPL